MSTTEFDKIADQPHELTEGGPVDSERHLRRVGLLGTGSNDPDRILSNSDLERMVETSDQWIRERTGMRERRIVGPNQATSDLAIEAGRRAVEQAGLAPEEIELIVVATVTPDTIFPPVACLVQHALGASKAAGFDLSAACSGFVNALMTADSLIAGGRYDNALVIGADVLSSITDYENRNTAVLFGDAAGAVVLGADTGRHEIIDHLVGIDGSGQDLICLPAGGSRKPASAQTVANGEHFMQLEGRKVFKFAVTAICNVVGEILARNGYSISDVDLLIPHQANLRIIEAANSKLGIDPARVVVNIERFGNTSSASIPLALDEIVRGERIQPGDLLCIVTFGGGLTWGASLIRW